MREIRLYGSEGGEAFNPLSLPLSFRITRETQGRARSPLRAAARGLITDKF